MASGMPSSRRTSSRTAARAELKALIEQVFSGLSAAQVLDTLDQAARVQVRRPVEVARLQAAISDTLHQPWPVQRMAALYCLSVPRFQVRWQALTGLSPQAWLRDQRLDAAQRQLAQTGWMHNRLRMVSASFYTKDLGLDWRQGEAWFAKLLLDFDLSANNGGWQWSEIGRAHV